METLCIFYEDLVYFTAIGNILWPFGIFCVHLVYFPKNIFGILDQGKSGNPGIVVVISRLILTSFNLPIRLRRGRPAVPCNRVARYAYQKFGIFRKALEWTFLVSLVVI
jgi:hypothetical protein